MMWHVSQFLYPILTHDIKRSFQMLWHVLDWSAKQQIRILQSNTTRITFKKKKLLINTMYSWTTTLLIVLVRPTKPTIHCLVSEPVSSGVCIVAIGVILVQRYRTVHYLEVFGTFNCSFHVDCSLTDLLAFLYLNTQPWSRYHFNAHSHL